MPSTPSSVGSGPICRRSTASSTTSFPTGRGRRSARSCGCRCRGGRCGAGSSRPTSSPSTDPARLRPLKKVVGAGPPAELLALADWAAWRWAGSSVAFLRVASSALGRPARRRRPGGADRAIGSRSLRQATPRPGSGCTAGRRRRRAARWSRALLAEHGSTIVVLPDARRTGALVRSLEAAGRTVVVLRSDQSAAERTRAWRAALAGDCVVVGGRTAVWAPVPDLGAIVVLDEGDEALKEERAPAWHARDVAIERARRLGARGRAGRPRPRRVDAIVGRRRGRSGRPGPTSGPAGRWSRSSTGGRSPRVSGSSTIALGDALRRAIDPRRAAPGGRAICVLNRKGRARLLACVACGELARCEACGAAVLETDDGLLACPRCATTRPKVCLHCHATRMKAVRPGVARLRDDLSALLPRATVAEVEAATAEIPPADVLVGHRGRAPPGAARPGATGPARRVPRRRPGAARAPGPRGRAGALARRAGGPARRRHGPGPGRILIQTRVPDHEVVEAARHGDPGLVAGPETDAGAALGYPPFGGPRRAERRRGRGRRAHATRSATSTGSPCSGRSTSAPGSGRWPRRRRPPTLCDALAAAVRGARALGRLRVEVDPVRV